MKHDVLAQAHRGWTSTASRRPPTKSVSRFFPLARGRVFAILGSDGQSLFLNSEDILKPTSKNAQIGWLFFVKLKKKLSPTSDEFHNRMHFRRFITLIFWCYIKYIKAPWKYLISQKNHFNTIYYKRLCEVDLNFLIKIIKIIIEKF